MSSGNSPNSVDHRITDVDEISVGELVTEVYDTSVKGLRIKDVTFNNASFSVVGVVDNIVEQASGNSPTIATRGSIVRIVDRAHIGVRIKCLTSCPGFSRSGAYYFVMQKDASGTKNVYQRGVTGTLVCLETPTLPAGYTGVRLSGGFRFIREEEDNMYLYRFACPGIL